MHQQILTSPDNEDLIFSLNTKELLKFSPRMVELFGKGFVNQVNSIEKFEKLAPLPGEFGSREVCYPELFDVKATLKLQENFVGKEVEEIGWYNPEFNTIHILIFPLSAENAFNLTYGQVIEYLDKLNKPAVLFDSTMEKVLLTNHSLIKILLQPLSQLGKGFSVSDFFIDKSVFEGLMNWIESNSNTHYVETKLLLKLSAGCWFEIALSKVKVDEDLRVLAIFKDINELVASSKNQDRKNLIFSRLSEVQNLFLSKKKDFNAYQIFLDSILDISSAKYGFIGEVKEENNGSMSMKIHAVTDFSKEGKASFQLIDKLKDDNFFFRHFDNLFGACIKTAEVICENDPPSNPYSSNKKIAGHPQILNFLGIPITAGEKVIGLIGLGNKPGGFNKTDIEDLKPFASTYSVILGALESEERNIKLQEDSSEKALILSTVGDHSPDTIVVLDEEFQIRFLSPGFKKHFKMNVKDEVARNKIRNIITKTLTPKYFQSDNQYRSRIKILLKNNEDRWLETSINIFEGQGDKKIIAFIRDVTVQVKSEHSLRDSLRKEKEFKDFLSDFMSIVAHEFKTPLATIMSSLDISEYYLSESSDMHGDSQNLNKHIQKMRSEVENLHKIVVNSLAFEKYIKENATIKSKKLKLNNFVISTLKQYGYFDQIQFSTDFSDDYEVKWDEFLMQTTIVNLVSNALKFNKGSVDPKVYLMKDESGLKILIEDFGVGISKKDLPFIFTPYFRGSNARDVEGTGLGLIAVKNFVKLHGGQVNVDSIEGEGTKVQVLFSKL